MRDGATVGLVGARGYVGQELLKILARHPRLEVSFAASTSQAPEDIASRAADAVLLAVANGQAAAYVRAIDRARPETVILDVSADHRVDDAWSYGLPELGRDRLRGARRIANPGCYATAAALAVKPLAAGLLDGPAHAFGVSGYSGAGATPSPRNDVVALRDNVMPYALIGHTHEREIERHAGPVVLLPHVAPFFRGIAMTVSFHATTQITTTELREVYARAYEGEPLVRLTDDIPLVKDAANQPTATLGGFAAEGRRGVVVVTLDNLLKGAASQAIQNLNLALGFPELEGILPWPP